jgi:DNA-binding NtrC family response regulator
MKDHYTILIADRNSHVRKFLQREMTAAGYQVHLAQSAGEVLKCAFRHEPLDLVILDPDLPDAEDTNLMQHLLDRSPALPVIVHSYPAEYGNAAAHRGNMVFVEKRGSSVERLKQVVYETLAPTTAMPATGLRVANRPPVLSSGNAGEPSKR